MTEELKTQERQEVADAASQNEPLERLLTTVKLEELESGASDGKRKQRDDDRLQFARMLRTWIEEMGRADESAAPAIDKRLIEQRIAEIDQILTNQVNEILHHPGFQELESTWRSVKFLVDKTNWEDGNVDIQLLDVSKEELMDDFEDKAVNKSGLAHHLFEKNYDLAGGEPVSAIVSNYEFDNSHEDMDLLDKLTTTGSLVHAPFIASVGEAFFGVEHLAELAEKDMRDYFDGSNSAYARYLSFREKEESRFAGLTLNKFLLRPPYEPSKRQLFQFSEEVTGRDARRYLWGSPAFAMAANMLQAFQRDGWPVQIRGIKGGGLISDLPTLRIDDTIEDRTHSTQVLFPDNNDARFSEHGFMPLMGIRGEPKAFFYSANSVQDPGKYEDPDEQATAKVMANLPYIFLASRLAHYLRVQQRDNIGTGKTRDQIESELQNWIGKLVNKTPNPRPEQIAKQPLKDASVRVAPIPGQPGWYHIDMTIAPHLYIEGIQLSLALVANMPQGK